jgi:hypothetical protein
MPTWARDPRKWIKSTRRKRSAMNSTTFFILGAYFALFGLALFAMKAARR